MTPRFCLCSAACCREARHRLSRRSHLPEMSYFHTYRNRGWLCVRSCSKSWHLIFFKTVFLLEKFLIVLSYDLWWDFFQQGFSLMLFPWKLVLLWGFHVIWSDLVYLFIYLFFSTVWFTQKLFSCVASGMVKLKIGFHAICEGTSSGCAWGGCTVSKIDKVL